MSSDSLLQRVKKVRISDTVVDQIISLIDEGKIKVGDQLPGERELVNQLQVGRASVREALRILEAQGVIEVHPGRGTFVTGEVSPSGGDADVIQWFQQHSDELLDMLAVRDVLDVLAGRLAAEKATPEQIDELESLLEQAETGVAEDDFDQLVNLDKQFHYGIAHASRNEMLEQLVIGCHEAMVSPRQSLQRLHGRGSVSLAEHRKIFEMIKSRDPDKAAEAIAEHTQSVRTAIISLQKMKMEQQKAEAQTNEQN